MKCCSHDRFTNQDRNNQVCIMHGAKVRFCSHEGLTNEAINSGVCIKNGAHVRFSIHNRYAKQVVYVTLSHRMWCLCSVLLYFWRTSTNITCSYVDLEYCV